MSDFDSVKNARSVINGELARVLAPDRDGVADHGGIVAFDQGRQWLQLGDGSEMSLDVLLRENMNAYVPGIIADLETLPGTFLSPQELAERLLRNAGATSRSYSPVPGGMVESAEKFVNAMKTASATTSVTDEQFRKLYDTLDAAASQRLIPTQQEIIDYILNEIGINEDPRAEAARWVSLITAKVTGYLRKEETDDE